MPLYEYFCLTCRKPFEVVLTLEEGLKVPQCPRCKSAKGVERRLSSFHAVTTRKW